MRHLLTLLICFFVLTLPAEARHLAVFEVDGPTFIQEWAKLSPDVEVRAKDWRYFDEFLKKVQDKYNNDDEELVIDIDTHGDPVTGMLAIDLKNETSMGSVLKKIEQFFPNRPNLVVCVEACYAGRCYQLTSRGCKDSYLPGGISTPPPFPNS